MDNVKEDVVGAPLSTAGLDRLHKCPNPSCGYLISDIQFCAARFDFPCPQCNKSHLSEFYIVKH